MTHEKKPYRRPELVELAPDDPRAARLRAELEELDRLAKAAKPS
jgi:hypothetical protein